MGIYYLLSFPWQLLVLQASFFFFIAVRETWFASAFNYEILLS